MNDLNIGEQRRKFRLTQYKPDEATRARPGLVVPPSTVTASNLTPSVARFAAKTHQRIVFKEVGHPIHAEGSIKTIFQAARDAAEALQFMSENQYIHRDGKLADLEYAKPMNTGGGEGVRTGTIAFMAVEVPSVITPSFRSHRPSPARPSRHKKVKDGQHFSITQSMT
ncbi:hypothetical protein M413DRAFT_25576 [Hebeloma cylindrosporum]|uniref:Fungal-type protein kinase domain-containing protein n=1 Tax=Hebeloma cylindrosporum TaxID=76867 RepID=A0A0C3C5J6_HEBCY|nr:hypothetical protein M413DRAFT_25576 [Hebeloma cylindrosporum h7]